jgi:RNA polymerase sigma-70 factor (ECF subfamily)
MARAEYDYATAETATAETPAAARSAESETASATRATSKLRTAGRAAAAKIKAADPGTGKARKGKAHTTHGAQSAADTDADTATAALDSNEAQAIDDTDPLTAAVHAAQAGDSEAFRLLYREVQPKLIRYLSFLVDSDDAEDIASETWLQATRDFHKFHGDIDNFRGWMSTIARHRAMDHLRKHSRQPPAVPMPVEEFSYFASADDTEARAIESITTDDAVKLISTLPKDQAEAVMLRAVIGLDAKTAAQVAGKRAGAIRTAAYRGLKTLAKRLGVPEAG